MDKGQKTKAQKVLRQQNVLESLKDIGAGTTKTLKKDLLAESSQDFFREILGTRIEKKYSGELAPGEALEIGEVFSGKREGDEKLKGQLALERNLAQEEIRRVEEKGNQLKLQLQALMQEVYELARSTQNLGDEVEVATMQAPANPGVYHLIFFEKLLEFVKSFRKKIENAELWLHSSNKRAEKKNYWAMYKKKGSSFLLAPDHYLQRSAG
ncbi:hypothetical protein HYT60_00605 [Candidatus Woesebacteria bacterium]|nr:hypothetical protein [Candidatus Woesebacteria bacterium]